MFECLKTFAYILYQCYQLISQYHRMIADAFPAYNIIIAVSAITGIISVAKKIKKSFM